MASGVSTKKCIRKEFLSNITLSYAVWSTSSSKMLQVVQLQLYKCMNMKPHELQLTYEPLSPKT